MFDTLKYSNFNFHLHLCLTATQQHFRAPLKQHAAAVHEITNSACYHLHYLFSQLTKHLHVCATYVRCSTGVHVRKVDVIVFRV